MQLSAQANRLVLLAITGQGIAYGLSIFVARQLSTSGFEAYVIASAVFILLAALAPLGSEKYTLRLLPVLLAAHDRGHAHGLLRFGFGRTLATALVAGTLVAIWAGAQAPGELRLAIIVTALSLPGGALVHYGLDLLTAAGRPFRALAIFRILVPSTALALIVAAPLFGVGLTGPLAVGAWGLGWLVALAALAVSLRAALPPALFTAPPVADLPVWRAQARPFLAYRLALALLAQAGIIALELSGPGGAAVGAYAAAMATTGMAAVLASATNRAYGRSLALLLDAGDVAAIRRLERDRLAWLALPIALFLFVTLAFPGVLLGLFRPEFADGGAAPLRLLALATAFGVVFALSPTWLKFRQQRRALYTITVVAAVLQLSLLLVLVPAFGATGAALSQAVSMILLYAGSALMAQRDMRRLQPA